MSCSTVKVVGSLTATQLPSEHPMLIANLRADSTVAEHEDWAWSRCNVPHGVWVQYPERYRGMNPPIVASAPSSGSPIKFWTFNDSDGFCSSGNGKLIQALALNHTICKLLTGTNTSLIYSLVPTSLAEVPGSTVSRFEPQSSRRPSSCHDSSSSFSGAEAGQTLGSLSQLPSSGSTTETR